MLDEVIAIDGLQNHHLILLKLLVVGLKCSLHRALQARETVVYILLR